MERIKPPRRPHPEDLDVTAVSGADVRRLFDACETWTELLCLSTLAYLGPRRRAASNLRRRDVDIERGTIRFREKGGKVITKPIPEEFAELLREAVRLGVIATDADSYVIPMARGQRRDGDRDDRLIWRTIKKLGERAGVEVHPHSLRAAFAVKFLETHPGEVEALQRLMGHSKMETTQIYLRRLDRERAMERVRDLSWGSPFASIAVEARTGFEPVKVPLRSPELPPNVKLAQLRRTVGLLPPDEWRGLNESERAAIDALSLHIWFRGRQTEHPAVEGEDCVFLTMRWMRALLRATGARRTGEKSAAAAISFLERRELIVDTGKTKKPRRASGSIARAENFRSGAGSCTKAERRRRLPLSAPTGGVSFGFLLSRGSDEPSNHEERMPTPRTSRST